MGSKQKTGADSQAIRRLKFGLNITAAVLAALGLVVLVNWIASRQYLRLDLTENRSYSLSAQTRTVLNKLKGDYRIVTLLPSDLEVKSEQEALVHRRVRDLVDEYARYTGHVTAEHMDARGDILKAQRLNAEIAKAFDDELAPVVEAIHRGRKALDGLGPVNKQIVAVLMSGLGPESTGVSGPVQELYQAAATRCQQIGKNAELTGQQADDLLGQVLVNYAGIKQKVQAVLTDYNAVLGVISDRAGELAHAGETDDADKERLLHVIELCKQAQDILAEPLKQMDAAKPSPRYNQVLYDLTSGASVVVLGEEKVKVVPVSEMWRQDARDYQQTGRTQPQYLIEEKLTGALLSMTLDQPPMVVFVTSGGGPALGERGQYNNVAQRLESADFRVTQWNPAGQMTQMGQPTPPAPRPQPQPGQKTIWIVLPTPGNQMNNPMMMMANPRQKIADLLKDRLAAGDAAMVLVSVEGGAAYGVANPITDFLNTWGLTPQIDRIILQEVQQDNRRSVPSLQFIVDTWPKDLPITTALNGMQAGFRIACPILIGEAKDTAQYPLIQIKGSRLWTHNDLSSSQAIQNAKFNEADSAPSFTIGVASERDGKRLVTIAEPIWASDSITGLGLLGPGTADLTGAAFPGNSELFVNSVYWLAGLEDLIAASPRSQDVPRINPMSDNVLWWHQAALLAGMPGGVLLLGLGVWAVRRRA